MNFVYDADGLIEENIVVDCQKLLNIFGMDKIHLNIFQIMFDDIQVVCESFNDIWDDIIEEKWLYTLFEIIEYARNKHYILEIVDVKIFGIIALYMHHGYVKEKKN